MTKLKLVLAAACIACVQAGFAAPPTDAQGAVLVAMNADAGLDADGVKRLVAAGAQLLDVRSADEWNAGHVEGAQHAYWLDLVNPVTKLWPDKSTPIVTYCAVGARSRAAALRLRAAGYTHVIAMTEGGYAELVKVGLPKAP